MDGALSIIWALAIECKNITEQIIYSLRGQAPTGHRIADTLLEKEILKLKDLHEKLLLAVVFLTHKKFVNFFSFLKNFSRKITLSFQQRAVFRIERVVTSAFGYAQHLPIRRRNSFGYFPPRGNNRIVRCFANNS